MRLFVFLQHQELKKQEKEDIGSFKKQLSDIQSLSEQKCVQLSAENYDLGLKIESLTVERAAFEEDNQAVLQLLMDQKVDQRSLVNLTDGGATLKSAVEKLLREREKQESTIAQLKEERKDLTRERDQLETNLQDLKRELDVLKTNSLENDKKSQAKVSY